MTSAGDLSAMAIEPFSKAISQFHDLISGCDSLTFLIGAGCSKCAGLPLINELTKQVLSDALVDRSSTNILADVRDIFAEATDSHIEDYLSEIVDLLAISDRRAEKGINKNTVTVKDTPYTTAELRKAIEQIKQAIANAINIKVPISTHQAFVTSIHRPIRVGRTTPTRPVDYLVLNYDTMIEDALALGNVTYADGLNGGATGWWDPDSFDAPGLSARVIKLHGSIDWRQFPNEQSPRRIGSSIKIPGEDDLPVLIWPSSTKYLETQVNPFAQLLDLARRAIRPTFGEQHLLVVCGYSFGDSHINLEIDNALKESEGKLTIVAFTNEDKPTGLLKNWHDNETVREQVLIFANQGFFHGSNEETSSKDLLWWQFETLTKILEGEV